MNELREILAELLNTGVPGTFSPNDYGNKKIDQATLAIQQWAKDRVLEPRKAMTKLNNQEMYVSGFNAAIEQTLKNLEGK